MDVVVLNAGIFPDRATVEEALSRLPAGCTRSIVEVLRPGSDERDWDRVLDRLLTADRIVVV
jgi:NAD(P)-dependent dehydrogenase (short-subunit alcohol dehydrogenase family)